MRRLLWIFDDLFVVTAHPRIALLGFREGLGFVGMTYDDDPASRRSRAYDAGRALRQTLAGGI